MVMTNWKTQEMIFDLGGGATSETGRGPFIGPG